MWPTLRVNFFNFLDWWGRILIRVGWTHRPAGRVKSIHREMYSNPRLGSECFDECANRTSFIWFYCTELNILLFVFVSYEVPVICLPICTSAVMTDETKLWCRMITGGRGEGRPDPVLSSYGDVSVCTRTMLLRTDTRAQTGLQTSVVFI